MSPRTKGYAYEGPRGKIQMHSSWEVKVARILDELQLTWIYEPRKFRTSAGGFIPDFWIDEAACYLEVKGYEHANAAEKLAAFRQEYPYELVVVRDINWLGMAYMVQRLYQLCLGVRYRELTPEDRLEQIRRNVLRAYQEIGELLEATPWKWHRVYENHEIDTPNLLEEFGDLFVFMLNIIAVVGLRESDVMAAVHDVHLKNFERLREGVNQKEMGS